MAKEEKDLEVEETEEETTEETEEESEEESEEGSEGSVAGDAALAADAKSKETGENTHGVLSPDPKVGQHVPSDLVMPGEKVDPRTGAVIEGAGSELATPRPNLPEGEGSTRPEEGKEWAGNHTV